MEIKKVWNYSLFALLIVFCISISISLQAQAPAQDPAQDPNQPTFKPAEKKIEEQKPWERSLTGWRVKDYRPYVKAMRDLQKVSVEYSEVILKLAMDEYAKGIDLLEDMENEVARLKEVNKTKKNLHEKYYWQEIDRKRREKRQIAGMKQEGKMKSITHFVKSINYLDEVSSKDINEKPEFINFKIRLYQVYVSTQYDLNNFIQCIPILERYITINDDARKDLWAYRYLSNCYAFMEAVLKKYKHATPEKQLSYRQKKNKAMLQAAEIQYGIDSVEYKHLQEVVEKDEIRGERLNDFK